MAVQTIDEGDHVNRALDRLAEQFKGQPVITAFLTALMSAGAQPLEDAAQAALLDRTIDDATGVQLDAIGVIVGQERLGYLDDDYRRLLRARISVHRSKGNFEDLIRVAGLVIYDDALTIVCHNEGTSTVTVRLAALAVTDALAALLIGFLRSTKSAGVKLWLRYSSSTPATTFTLDSGPGLDVGHLATALE